MLIKKQMNLTQLFLREPNISSSFKDFMKESCEGLRKSGLN